jgi:ferric-dicitrate binding protein FerR (iron transport regulator)
MNTINSYVELSPENRIYFQEIKNIWELTHPVFDSNDIDVGKAYKKVMAEAKKKKTVMKLNHKKVFTYWGRVAAAVLIPVIALSVFLHKTSQNKSQMEVTYQKIFSQNGTTSEIILPDGSVVYLNAGSSLQYPTNFNENRRNVNLEGEAYFQVRKDAQKPFIVHTQKMNIEVLGTKFNVSAYSDLSEIKTTLEEGKVKVIISGEDKEDNYYLDPNEELSLNVETGDITKKQVDASDIKEWFQGNLVFKSALLSDALKQIARKYNVQIDSQTAEIAHKRLTVRFESEENLNDIFSVLQSIVPDLVVDKRGNRYRVDIRK